MKKFILMLLITVTLISCSKESVAPDCQCTTEVQFYYYKNGITHVGDHYSNPIQNPDCSTNGQSITEESILNDGILRKVTTIQCH